jgi:hypothetical protein
LSFFKRSRCEAALAAYENGGDLPPGWTMPPVRDDDEDIEEEPFDPKKPPEPPDKLDFFEWQRTIGKLTEWSRLCGLPANWSRPTMRPTTDAWFTPEARVFRELPARDARKFCGSILRPILSESMKKRFPARALA